MNLISYGWYMEEAVRSFRIAMIAACPFPAAFASSGLIRELSMALSKRGHQVHIITYHLGRNDFDVDRLTIHRIPKVPGYHKLTSGISMGKPLLDFLLTVRLFQILRKYRFDVIHAHNYEAPPAGYIARYWKHIPVIYHAHNTMYHELPTYFQSPISQCIARTIGQRLDQMIPPRADHIIAVSDNQKHYLSAIGVPPHHITMIPPCIDPQELSTGDGGHVRRNLHLTDEPLLIYTGGLHTYQNSEGLIHILKNCLAKRPDIHLLVVARSSPNYLYQRSIEVGVADRVHFVEGGGLNWERDCLAAATIGVIPREQCIGFPIKMLNYLAAKKPVVCYKSLLNGFKSGKEVIALPDGDHHAVAQAIIDLLEHPAQAAAIAQNGYQAVIERHHWDQAIPVVESIYQSLC